MASGLLAFFDDISVILDDVAAMSKIAARKTAGIVGDDLAVNANVVVGIDPTRELPIVGKIALGSLLNKVVLIPLALALPTAAIHPLLMVGGAFLCYEALHKMMHKKDSDDQAHEEELLVAVRENGNDLMKVENQKVKGAIATDAVLSAEVIAVALGAVATAPLKVKALTLGVVGLVMTVGVYGLVAIIVKVDDLGMHLGRSTGAGSEFKKKLGAGLVASMPIFMKCLSVVGTVAMFTVGGGLLLHGMPLLEHGIEAVLGSHSRGLLATVVHFVTVVGIGMLAGLITMPLFQGLGRLFSRLKGSSDSPERTAAEAASEPPESERP
jgi:predicted DNA repair protein MutK